MADTCETVKIVSPKSPGGYVVINKDDFDEKKHKIYEEPDAELVLEKPKSIADTSGEKPKTAK